MDGEQRRNEIIKKLENEQKPVSASVLAKAYNVSRQVIVQDIALLRARGYDILATARGYILNKEIKVMQQRVLIVRHDKEKAEEELNIIIDNGGRVRNVIVSHPIYGQLVGDLMLQNRRDIKQFVGKLEDPTATPLLNLTDGVHMHTIEATTQQDLDIIEDELNKKGFLVD